MPSGYWTKSIIDEGELVSGVSWNAHTGFKAGDNVGEGPASDVLWEGEIVRVASGGEDEFRFFGPILGSSQSYGTVQWRP